MPATYNQDGGKKARPSMAALEKAIEMIRGNPNLMDLDIGDDIIVGLLEYYNLPRGPIVGSTRNLYKKLIYNKINQKQDTINANTGKSWDSNFNTSNHMSTTNQHNYDDDEEDEDDEDYQVEEEEESSEDEEASEDEDSTDPEEEDKEELLNELSDDDIKVTDITQADSSSTMTAAISKTILTIIITFFIAIFSFYLYSTSNFITFPANVQKLTKLLLVIAAFSPIGIILYKTVSYYRRCRDEDSKRVNNLVNDALEIIQSPENPKGLMPILHIRDTLLTPAERKTKRMIQLWNKAVKFIEKHESRVKIEIINIDGEDFRAWKWIGLKNTKVN